MCGLIPDDPQNTAHIQTLQFQTNSDRGRGGSLPLLVGIGQRWTRHGHVDSIEPCERPRAQIIESGIGSESIDVAGSVPQQ